VAAVLHHRLGLLLQPLSAAGLAVGLDDPGRCAVPRAHRTAAQSVVDPSRPAGVVRRVLFLRQPRNRHMSGGAVSMFRDFAVSLTYPPALTLALLALAVLLWVFRRRRLGAG